MKINLLIIIPLLASCVPLSQGTTTSGTTAKLLRNIDLAYEPQIRTIGIHPPASAPGTWLLPAVAKLGQQNLRLEFDDLRPEYDYYYARIVHCNRDWSKSDLSDLDFLAEYNEFTISNYEFSVDTHIPYVHYWMNIPHVKLPGNYLLVVYRGTDKNDLILSKRFMVYDSRVAFTNEKNLIGAGNVATLYQQINFTISYKNLEFINPLENVNVTIRQNDRWDNMVADLKPSFVREIEKELEYRFFDESNMFRGGNEFRFFDLRSLNSPGRNINKVDKTVKPHEVYIALDKPRGEEPYAIYRDDNGGFTIENLDYRDVNFTNYAFVHFALASKKLPGEVFATGSFNYWNMDEQNRMTYDSAAGLYHTRVLLKQGLYNYQYVIKSPELALSAIEGSHFETENSYEILVYYRPFQPRADLLIGYLRLDRNPQLQR